MIELTNYPTLRRHRLDSFQEDINIFVTDISSFQWNKKTTCATVCEPIIYNNSQFDIINENDSKYFVNKVQASGFFATRNYNKIGIPPYYIFIATNCHRPNVKFHHDWTEEDWNLVKSKKPDHAWFQFKHYEKLSSMSAIYKTDDCKCCNAFDFMLNVTFDDIIAK